MKIKVIPVSSRSFINISRMVAREQASSSMSFVSQKDLRLKEENSRDHQALHLSA
jgi:hypothetical protein